MQMFRTKCAACDWTFDVAALPMPITAAARVMKHAACPMCGNVKDNTCGASRPLTREEALHKSRLNAGQLPGGVNHCPHPEAP